MTIITDMSEVTVNVRVSTEDGRQVGLAIHGVDLGDPVEFNVMCTDGDPTHVTFSAVVGDDAELVTLEVPVAKAAEFAMALGFLVEQLKTCGGVR